jgi:transcriptional regulator with XRE-family HTH domain
MTFGKRLKSARETAGYSQAEFGEACGWASAQPRVANYEADSREPTLADIIKMAKVAGIPPEELAFGAIGLTQDEAELVQAWRLSDGDGKEAFRAIVKVSRRPRRHKRTNLKDVSARPPKDHKAD